MACSFDAPLPIECEDEYWETEDPEQTFRQPPGEPCTTSYWITFMKLLDIIGFAQQTLVRSSASSSLVDRPPTHPTPPQYAVRKTDMWTRMGMTGREWNEKIVAELDSALNAWVDTIPEHRKHLVRSPPLIV